MVIFLFTKKPMLVISNPRQMTRRNLGELAILGSIGEGI
jgi:hypothetical protein